MTALQILIVEDDSIVARDLRETIEAMGHTVIAVVESVEAARRVVEEQEVGLALLDIRVPGEMDGVDLGHLLTRDHGIPIVYLTGFSDEETLRRARASRPLNFLIKPVSERELRSALEIALERDGVEKRLRDRERWYAALVDSISDGLVACDAQGRITLFNPAVEAFVGLRHADVLRRPVDRILDFRDGVSGQPLDDPVRRALEEDRVCELGDSAVFRRRDGTWIPVSGDATPMRTDDGSLLGVVLTLRDVRTHRQARDAMDRSEARYRTVFEESPLPMHISTLDEGQILDLNPSFAQELGYPGDDALGRTEEELGLWARAEDRAELVEALGDKERVAGFRTRLRTQTGELRNVDLSAQRVELEGTHCLMVVTRDVTDRVTFEEELERQALYDTLTGLPNRTLLRDRLAHALDRSRRENTGTAVLFIDLDDFKRVNDTLGHAAGDEVLRQVADRLQGCLRERDTVARLGGDEFAAILEDTEKAADAAASAERVLEALASPVTVRGTSTRIGASIGIAPLGDLRVDADDLLRFSDMAMYRAKAEGGGTFRIFEPEEDFSESGGLHEEYELRNALEREEFVLRYQPIVELDSDRVVGAEALVRWRHPEKGLLHPVEFLPLAEESGLTSTLGRRLLRSACRESAVWSSARGATGQIFLAMNLAPGHFRDREVARDIERILAEEGTDPSCLVLEVTEGVAFQSPTTIRALRTLGLKVALDDVGTGLSSFSGLKELGTDLLKVDRSFVDGLGRDHPDGVIVDTLLRYARGTGQQVVAEGVETEEQRERLLEMGCRLGQGYHLAEPQTSATLAERLG